MRTLLLALLAFALLAAGGPAAATTGVQIGRFGTWLLETAPQMPSPEGQPMPPMRYQAPGESRDGTIAWLLSFERDRVELSIWNREGCSRIQARSTRGLDDRSLARELGTALSAQLAEMQRANCVGPRSTAPADLRRAQGGLVTLLRGLRKYRRDTRDPMA